MHPKIPSIRDILSTLVACPSVNPGDLNTWEEPYGEATMAECLKEILLPWADSVQIIEVLPGRPNLIATFKGDPNGPKRVLEAHLDTVDVTGMQIPPFDPAFTAGRIYGRGSADTKGPMTAMLAALLRAKSTNQPLNGDWFFIATCDEELGGRGAQHLIKSGFRCDGIIVAEPTELALIDVHKGVERYRVTVTGKAAHSAYPELGANAIAALSECLVQLNALSKDTATQFGGCDAIGPLTTSVGTIQGGDQVNRVPQTASAEIDFRIPPNLPPTTIAEMLESASQLVRTSSPAIMIEWTQTQHYPPLSAQRDSPFIKNIETLARKHLKFDHFSQVRYATNAGFFASAGIPCLVFGPGSIAEAHTANESIDLDSIEQATDFLEKVITEPLL